MLYSGRVVASAPTHCVAGTTAILNVYSFNAGERMNQEPLMMRRYERSLPGEGFVAIDVCAAYSLLRGRRFVGELRVERRNAARRAGHCPPTVGRASGPTIADVVSKLLPIAESNVSIGVALQAWGKAPRRRRSPTSQP
jgi:hypothetical protein